MGEMKIDMAFCFEIVIVASLLLGTIPKVNVEEGEVSIVSDQKNG